MPIWAQFSTVMPDRAILIDEHGNFVEPYYLNCLLAKIMLGKMKTRSKKIVIDARLPVGLGEVIKTNGGHAVISRSGYANIVSLMKKKEIVFGCERIPGISC